MSDHGSNCSIEEIGTEELEEGLQSPEASPEVSGVAQYFGSVFDGLLDPYSKYYVFRHRSRFSK